MNVRVAAAVVNQTPLDWEGNFRRIRDLLEKASEANVEVICFPELCLSGYGCEDAFHAPDTSARAWSQLQRLLPSTKGMLVCLGLPIWHNGAVYNASVVVSDGKPIGIVAKQHLAGDGIHYEPRWFKSWPAGVTTTWLSPDGELPLGDLLFELRQGAQTLRIGLEICEDAWVAERPGGRLAGRNVDLILNPSASHFAFDKQKIRERFVIEGSRAFMAGYVYANLVGNESGRAIFDGGALLASGGEILGRGPRFSFAEGQLTIETLNVAQNRVARARTSSFKPSVASLPDVISEFAFRGSVATAAKVELEAWERNEFHKEEEFARAVSLALFDYMRKSRSKGFVLSLSGGADSATCAVLIHIMQERLREELSLEDLTQKFAYWPKFSYSTKEVLTTVYQATKNSGSVTRNAAKTLADALGARHVDWDVDELVEGYKNLAQSALGRDLSWETDDIALQNIQARVRAPGPWMLANVLNALFLSTSNRSEAAVGYATMDGDTSGGLAPIAGIDKDFIRHWLRWMEETGLEGFEPVPALAGINSQDPTAELRPSEQTQTDEEDLMPYPVLERIERLAIRDKLSPKDIFERLAVDFTDSSPQDRLGWVTRFFRLFTRNQWKRERYAPSFHLDDQNLDPKSWCRFPILSGGYALELEELRKQVES